MSVKSKLKRGLSLKVYDSLEGSSKYLDILRYKR